MVFASSIFLYYFLPLFLAAYYLGPKRARSLTITIASYVFYGWWRPDFVLLMLTSTLLDYVSGARIARARSRGERGRPWLVLSICCNLALLGYFKYANFGVETLNELLHSIGVAPVEWTYVVLPVGISFYSFQTLSYTVDVYRGDAPPARNVLDFTCFVAMFPQLVAGPIVRYNSVAGQLVEREHSLSRFYLGVLSFQAGLAKKLLIADLLGQVADDAFAAQGLSTLDAWIGAIAYAFQIYFDFSGYSDMAIGLGLMLGFRFPINFEQPYRSVGITDFWRRWHISLSTFLRDYLYVPLGGNRKGTGRTYVNLAAVMLLGGFWHGAAWTFLLWGAYQGFWLIVERLAGKGPLLRFAPRPVQIAITFVIVLFGWVLFRAESLSAAGSMAATMLGFAPEVRSALEMRPIHWIAGGIAMAIVWLAPTTQSLLRQDRSWWAWVLMALFGLSILHLHFLDHVPFIYFQF